MGTGGAVACLDCPPDPALLAPPLDRSIATTTFDAGLFLYTGPSPIQTGVAPGTIEQRRAAILRGQVLDRSGAPVPGVVITVLDHAELGATKTRLDGFFDLVVNGGGSLTVEYQKSGLLPVQRRVDVPWADWVSAPDVVMIPRDPKVTSVTLPAPAKGGLARGSVVTDLDGKRQATLFFQPGTTAVMKLADGSTQPLTSLHVRATEYTVGPRGPQAMPASLPPATAYTYAVDYSVDEALAAGAVSVEFSQPVIQYVENFLGFPAGGKAPMGSYDPLVCGWEGSGDGRVITVVAVAGGVAGVDITGDGVADSAAALTALGITPQELAQLGAIYSAGQQLWRVPVPHFSPWDTNWPGRYYGKQGPKKPPKRRRTEDDDCSQKGGSIIGVEDQILGERIPLSGTPYALRYQSLRTPGFQEGSRFLTIPVTDSAPAADLERVELEVTIAGRRVTKVFGPLPDQSFDFQWDGKDAYGRQLQGGQTVSVRIANIYHSDYAIPSDLTPSFGDYGGGTILVADSARQEIAVVLDWSTDMPAWHASGEGIGGFFLDVHHSFDPVGKTVYLGNGTKRSAENSGRVVETLAGGGSDGNGEGIPGKSASLSSPSDIVAGPDGSVYIAETGRHRVRKVAPDGTISTVAGTAQHGYSGDGGPATSAELNGPRGLALGPDGSLYIADADNFAIRQITPDGVMHTVADPMAFDGVNAPINLAVTPGGTIYVAAGGPGYGAYALPVLHRVRLGACGEVTLVPVAGNGMSCNDSAGGCGDGGLGTLGQLATSHKRLALDRDGALLFVDGDDHRIRKLGPDGLLAGVAGNGQSGSATSGIPALTASLGAIDGIAVDRDGRIYVGDPYAYSIHSIDQAGVIATIGGGTNYAPSPADGAGAHTGGIQAKALAAHPDGRLLFVEKSLVRAIRPAFRGLGDDEFPVPSEDGGEIWVFDSHGRHLRTLHGLTGATVRTFGYDAKGHLTTITDADGNVTTVQRNAGGEATAIVAPHGQTTQLALDADGQLATITNPGGEVTTFGYQGATGLLTSLTDPLGNASTFTYDGLGRLASDADAEGGVKTLAHSGDETTYDVAFTSGAVPLEGYGVSRAPDGAIQRTRTDPAGSSETSVVKADGSITRTSSNGMTTALQIQPDPRWGTAASIVAANKISAPDGVTNVSVSTHVNLADPADPLSLSSLDQTFTVNGRSTYVSYDAATRMLTMNTAQGRTAHLGLTASGKVASRELVGLLPSAYAYDASGRLISASQGTRGASIAYGADGLPSSLTDGLTQTLGFTYDAVGRRTALLYPDGRQVLVGRDKNGKPTSFTPPGRPPHAFSYDKAGRVTGYTPPLAAQPALSFAYTPSRQLASITYPDAVTLGYAYDAVDRLQTISTPEGPISLTYDAVEPRRPATILAPGGVDLDFTYTAARLTGLTMSGPVAGTVSSTYDVEGRLATTTAADGPTIGYSYDNDGLLTSAGDLYLARDAQTGNIIYDYVGGLFESYTTSAYGETDGTHVEVNGVALHESTVDGRDALGRVTARTEVIGAETHAYTYAYDTSGRLTTVTTDGAVTESYTFDSNDNRLTGPGATATYDAADRLMTYGSKTYSYDPAGALSGRTDTATGLSTAYQYNRLGSLRKVTLPDGRIIDYVIDGLGRRVGKKVDGVLQRGFLYAAPYRPAVELDGAGAVVSTFVYATRDNVPDYMIRGGDTYRLVTDASGSVRLVIRVDTGDIAERIDYDSFGNIVADTQPGFQPFGFGGGLYDADTGLVQFGLRDYDPETGRFTARDPLLFAGGQANLYAYAHGDPVNFRDPSGAYTCSNVVGGTLQLVAAGGDILGGGMMIAGAVAEMGTIVAAPLAPLEATLGTVTVVQGLDELRRGITLLNAGDDENAISSWDSTLGDVETANSLGALGGTTAADRLVHVLDKKYVTPIGPHPTLSKGLTLATLVSAIPTQSICDAYHKFFPPGGEKKKGDEDPECP